MGCVNTTLFAPISAESAYPYMRNATAESRKSDSSDVLRRHDKLIRFVARRFGSRGVEMDDLVQEGRIALLRAMDTYRDSDGVRLWTYARKFVFGAMVRYVSKDAENRRAEEQAAQNADLEPFEGSPEDLLILAEGVAISSRELINLSDIERQVIRLHFVDGMHFRAIAREWGDADHSRVKRIYHGAIASLRERVGAKL